MIIDQDPEEGREPNTEAIQEPDSDDNREPNTRRDSSGGETREPNT